MLRARLNRLVGQLEAAQSLDPAARFAQRAAGLALRGRVGDVLRGEPIDHPLHPALVVVPMGAWLSASLLDLSGGDAAAARRLIAFGCLGALPAAAAGAADFLDTKAEERRVTFVHAAINDLALLLYFSSWRSRRGGRRVKGTLLALAGSGVLLAGGWLGGHLAFRLGVGVATH